MPARADAAASGHRDDYARRQVPGPALWPRLAGAPPYPARLNCAAALLDAALAAGAGARPAVCGAHGCWSYATLARHVDQIAHVLCGELKLVPGQRVLLRGANEPMLAACILAVLKAGCIAVPTMALLRAGELAVLIEQARVDAVLCAAEWRAELDLLARCPPTLCFGPGAGAAALEPRMARQPARFAAADTAADDVCLISFTSGTSGVPKGTMHFQRDLLAICDCFPRAVLGTRADDIFIGTPPLAFTFGLGALLLFPLRVGACSVLLERPGAAALLREIGRHRATLCFSAPTLYRQMAPLAAGHDLRSLRHCVSAGEALTPATRAAWRAASALELVDGLGATELLHIFISAAGAQIRPGAIGKALPGYQVCILDQDGRPLGPGATGRLAVRGPTGCRYLADEARQRDYVRDGWNLTGDACAMDADGYVYYRARCDDMIVSAGYNIGAPEVEDALLCHPAVAECGVVGRADPARGQIVAAHVVLAAGVAPSAQLARALQDFVKQRIAPYKYPRALRFVAALPRSGTGKLQRHKLREQEQT